MPVLTAAFVSSDYADRAISRLRQQNIPFSLLKSGTADYPRGRVSYLPPNAVTNSVYPIADPVGVNTAATFAHSPFGYTPIMPTVVAVNAMQPIDLPRRVDIAIRIPHTFADTATDILRNCSAFAINSQAG